MKAARLAIALMSAAIAQATGAYAQSASDQLKDYLVDIGPGPVSAADLIGLSAAAVTNVQSLKDLNVLLAPAAGSDQKNGVGLQITPGRTQWSPISATDYVNSNATRLLASISLSYAQNKATYGGVDYRQQGAALHVAYYPNDHDDPIVAAHEAFAGCKDLFGIEKKKVQGMLDMLKQMRADLGREPTPAERAKAVADYNASAAFLKLADEADAAVRKCVADGARDKWNKLMVSATLGNAWIQPDKGGSNLTLGRSLSLATVFPAGNEGAVNVLARFGRREVDTDTLATSPTYRNRSLIAARYTYRGGKDSKLFGIAEASNAKRSDATISSAAFKYALGVDTKVLDAFWIEFRVGRARSTSSSTGDETKALLSVKWSPTPSLPTLFAKQ